MAFKPQGCFTFTDNYVLSSKIVVLYVCSSLQRVLLDSALRVALYCGVLMIGSKWIDRMSFWTTFATITRWSTDSACVRARICHAVHRGRNIRALPHSMVLSLSHQCIQQYEISMYSLEHYHMISQHCNIAIVGANTDTWRDIGSFDKTQRYILNLRNIAMGLLMLLAPRMVNRAVRVVVAELVRVMWDCRICGVRVLCWLRACVAEITHYHVQLQIVMQHLYNQIAVRNYHAVMSPGDILRGYAEITTQIDRTSVCVSDHWIWCS